MSHVEKLLRLKDFSESFALAAVLCIPDRKACSGAFAGSAGRETLRKSALRRKVRGWSLSKKAFGLFRQFCSLLRA